MTGSHAVGDYVVFNALAHGCQVRLRGYIQKAIGGSGEPVAYIIRAGAEDFEVREQDVVNG